MGRARTATTDSLAQVTILSPGQTVDVFDGSLYFGTTPIANQKIAPGMHVFRFRPANKNNWLGFMQSETLHVAVRDSIFRSIELPALYHISSEPYGATILSGDSVVGYTPVLLWIPKTGRNLRLDKEGYESTEILLTASTPQLYIELTPKKDGKTPSRSALFIETQNRNDLPVYASASIALVSGVVSAYFKIKADNYYNDYRTTGYEGNLSKIHSYDRISGFSLAIEEVSLVSFTYFLLTR